MTDYQKRKAICRDCIDFFQNLIIYILFLLLKLHSESAQVRFSLKGGFKKNLYILYILTIITDNQGK